MTNDTGNYEPSDAAEAIKKANTDLNRWMVQGRTDRLEELLDDGFVLVHITGYVQSKAEWLAQIDSGEMTYHGIREQSVKVEVHGDTAVLVARNLVDATIWGSRATWPLEMTTPFAKQEGRWRPTRSRAITY